MTNSIIMFIHIMAAAVGVGASAYCLFLLLPRVDVLEKDQDLDENALSYKIIELLVPTVFVCLLLLVGSGIYYLMDNYTDQVNLKDGYYNIFGMKMMFAVPAFLLSVYVTFAVKPRIAHLDLKPENRKLVRPTLDTLRMLSQVTLGAIVFAVFMGIYLTRF